MYANHDVAQQWREKRGRVAVFAVVACCHAGLLVSLWRGNNRPWHTSYTKSVEQHEQDVLQIRFFDTPAPLQTPTRDNRQSVVPVPKRKHQRRASTTVKIAADELPAVTETPQTPRPSESANRTVEPGYIAGGNLLRGDGMNHIPEMHLPGSEATIVPGIHLVDPRTQGVAGVARVLQTLLGVADAQCVNVDHWRTLSTQEMLAQHISPDQVQEIAEAHHCQPKP